MRPSQRLLLGSLAALAAVLLLVGLRLGGGLPRQTVRLPDGEVLHLQEITVGATHQWIPLTWWQRIVNPLAPGGRLSRPYVTRFWEHGNVHPHLVFWFTAPGTLHPGRPGQRPVFAADETGREYAQVENLHELRPGRPRVEYFRVPLPRSSSTITLRFYGESGPEFSEITVPNPAREISAVNPAPTGLGAAEQVPPAPARQAPGCPVTARAGDVSVTLAEVTAGLSAGGRSRVRPEMLLAAAPSPHGPGEAPWTRARVRFERGEQEWMPLTMSLRDADGNVATQSYQSPQGGDVWIALPGWIAPEGGPVSARLLIQRRHGYHYPPEQHWTIPGVTVPAEGQETKLNLTRTIRGAQLELLALAARGTPTGPGRGDEEKSPYLRLRATGLTGERLLSVWAIDQRGSRYVAERNDYAGTRSSYDLRVRMPIARDAKRVTLHLAVHPRREVRALDFALQPSRLDLGAARNSP